MQISAQQKEQLQKDILITIANALDKEELKEEEIPHISHFMLNWLPTILTQEDVHTFLQDLTAKWPLFKTISLVEAGKEKEQKEDKVLNDVVALTQKGNIDEAIKLARTVTQ